MHLGVHHTWFLCVFIDAQTTNAKICKYIVGIHTFQLQWVEFVESVEALQEVPLQKKIQAIVHLSRSKTKSNQN